MKTDGLGGECRREQPTGNRQVGDSDQGNTDIVCHHIVSAIYPQDEGPAVDHSSPIPKDDSSMNRCIAYITCLPLATTICSPSLMHHITDRTPS